MQGGRGGIDTTCHTLELCSGYLWACSERQVHFFLILFFLLFYVCRLGQALIVARRGEVSKKYSSPLNTPRAAESILRPAHKAQRFSQQSTNSGVIMMLLVCGGGRGGGGSLAEEWE